MIKDFKNLMSLFATNIGFLMEREHVSTEAFCDAAVAKFTLKVHKIENFLDSDFGICVISLLVMSKY